MAGTPYQNQLRGKRARETLILELGRIQSTMNLSPLMRGELRGRAKRPCVKKKRGKAGTLRPQLSREQGNSLSEGK